MSGENGIPAELLKRLGGAPMQKLTPFEAQLLDRISSVTTALYALNVQMEAGRMQVAAQDSHNRVAAYAKIEDTAKHAQDVATLALKLAGALPLVEKLGAQEAGG